MPVFHKDNGYGFIFILNYNVRGSNYEFKKEIEGSTDKKEII